MYDKAIGIDLGGTSVKGVRIDRSGSVLQQCHEKTDFRIKSLDDPVHWSKVVKQVCAELDDSGALPVGVSAPGLAADDDRSIAIMPGRFPGLEGFDWPNHLGRDAVFVLNDAKAALIAEANFGAGVNCQNIVLLTLGTGVGGAIMINGELVRGNMNRAGHLGHISLDIDGPAGITGIPGSLEFAVGNATVEERSNGKFHSTAELIEAVNQNDQNAEAIWNLSVRKLAVGVCSIINVISPELVILGGGISQAGETLMEPLSKYMDMYEWRPNGTATPIRIAKFLELSGAIGAAGYAFKKSTNGSV